MKKKYIPIGLVLVLLIGIAIYYFYPRTTTGKVNTVGTIEVHQYDITPRSSGYIEGLNVDLGSRITAGETLFTLSEPTTNTALDAAKASQAQGAANLADLQAGAREDQIKAYKALVDSATVSRDQALREFNRYEALYAEDAVSAQVRDQKQQAYDVAQQNLAKATADYQELLQGTRSQQIAAAQSQVEALKANVASAQSKVEDLMMKSPVNGLVLTKNYNKGEYVKAGAPVLTIADMQDAWVHIYVSTEQLALIKVGDKAQIKVDGLPGQIFEGYIERISPEAEYTPRQSITKTERHNLVYKVRIKVNNGQEILKPGMPVDMVIP